MHVLVAAFSQGERRRLVSVLRAMGAQHIVEATCMEDALTLVEHCELELALVSPRLARGLHDECGLDLIAELRGRREILAVVVGEPPDTPTMRRAMRCGASDWLSIDKITVDNLRGVLDELRTIATPRPRPLPRVDGVSAPGQVMVGRSAPLTALRDDIARVSGSMYPVLVHGQSGTGKELVVQELRRVGPRPASPLLDLNCGAIPDALLESQLFGHKRGAFTGADRDQEGYLSAVGSGYLFLDEIAELPLPLQAKLLRVLETRRYRMIGSTKECQFSGRVVAATHADLASRCAENRFREDLYYRLAVLELRVPTLAERQADVPLLLDHFVARQERSFVFSDAATRKLCGYPWPGNIRQLRNLVTRVALLTDESEVGEPTVERLLRGAVPRRESAGGELDRFADSVLDLDVPDKLHAAQDVLIARSVARCGGNKSAAARALGVHRKVLERRLGKHEAESSEAGVGQDGPLRGRHRPVAYVTGPT